MLQFYCSVVTRKSIDIVFHIQKIDFMDIQRHRLKEIHQTQQEVFSFLESK
jgi:hypothetical protein